MSEVSASTKPWSRVTWVALPVSESIAATGLGAEAFVDDELEDESALLPHAATERLAVATRATAARPLRVRWEKMVLIESHIRNVGFVVSLGVRRELAAGLELFKRFAGIGLDMAGPPHGGVRGS